MVSSKFEIAAISPQGSLFREIAIIARWFAPFHLLRNRIRELNYIVQHFSEKEKKIPAAANSRLKGIGCPELVSLFLVFVVYRIEDFVSQNKKSEEHIRRKEDEINDLETR